MIAQEPHALALLARLGTVTMAGQPLKVGDAIAPRSATTGKVVAPCTVLYGRDGGQLMGSLGCIDTDAEISFQTTSIGTSASEARTVDDKCHAALTGSELVVAGRWIAWIRPRFGLARIEHDTTVTPNLFYVPRQYRLLSLQAS